MPDAKRIHQEQLGERRGGGGRERERRARGRPVEGEPDQKGGRVERERDLVCRDPGVVKEGAEREVRRNEGEGASGERRPPARKRKRKRRKRERSGGKKLVAHDVQEPARGVKGPEQQGDRQRRVERAGAVS